MIIWGYDMHFPSTHYIKGLSKFPLITTVSLSLNLQEREWDLQCLRPIPEAIPRFPRCRLHPWVLGGIYRW